MTGDLLDRLQAMLNNAGISDETLVAGATLNESGIQKVARKLMVESNVVKPMIRALATRLRESQSIEIDEAETNEPRFSFEKDYLKNVIVRDNQTGKQAFLRGHEAAALLNRLGAGGDPQQVLAAYSHLMEDEFNVEGLSARLDALEEHASLSEAKATAYELDEDDDSFHHEIHASHGSYNFPWSADGRKGYATARYRGRGRDMKISILSIRDDEGADVEDAGHLGEVVHAQAIDFIGRE